jgi:mannosyltransferase
MIQTVMDRFRSRQLERHFVATLILVAAGAMTISLMVGLQQSVWFDEAYSILLAKQPVMNLIHLTSMDTHPPLYYLLLKGWATLFGWSELALRSLSVVAMGGAVVLGGLLVKRMFGVRAAIVSLPFAALSPFLLRYGFEIRMYALASLIGIAATYTLVVALETRDRARQWKLYTLYAVLVAIGVYTLYYTVLLWIAHFIWLSWRAYQEKKPIIKSPWFAAFAGSVLLFLPWLPMFASQVGNGALAAISQQVTLDNLSGIVSFAFLYMPAWELDGYTTVIVLFVIFVIGVLTTKAFKAASKKERSYLVLLASYTVVPIMLIALLSLVRPMYVERYISHVLMGGLLFIGVGAAYATRKASPVMSFAVGTLFVILLLGVAQLSEVGNYNFQRLQQPAIKTAAASIGTCSKNTTIFAADPYVATELSYYLSSCEIRFYSASDILKGGFAPFSDSPLRIANPSKQLENSPKLVYVYYGQSRLVMPSLLTQISHHVYGSLNVDTFITK